MENLNSRVILCKKREASLERRHPWVFSGAIERVNGEIAPGDVVSVMSASGEFLGKGFWNPDSQIRVRLLTFENIPVDEDFFRRRFEEALALRKRYLSPEVTGYRLIHSDGDRLPGIVVDRYGEGFVFQIDVRGGLRLKPLLISWLQEQFSPKFIIERTRSEALKKEGIVGEAPTMLGTVPDLALIREYGVTIGVDVKNGQKTGFFLDQRENRRRLAEYASTKRVLNCFSYSGGFSVAAAHRGAVTTSVDISEPAIQLAERNFELNGFESDEHAFVVADVFEYLKSVQPDQFDIIVLDPPSFAKSLRALPEAQKAYLRLNKLAMSKLPPGGVLLSCSCTSYMDEGRFQAMLFNAALQSGRHVQFLEKATEPIDHPRTLFHPEKAYLKAFFLRVV